MEHPTYKRSTNGRSTQRCENQEQETGKRIDPRPHKYRETLGKYKVNPVDEKVTNGTVKNFTQHQFR